MAKTLPRQYCVCVREDGSPREISRTGSVITYKAVDYRTGLPVALQTIPAGNVEESARARVQEEAHRAQQLEHVNIAKLLDVRLEDEHLLLASEFILGETAEHWLVAHGPMPSDAVLRVMMQVVDALSVASSHGLHHRAIQPSNLMIVPGASPDGGWPFVKLLNFGLAGLRLYGDDKTATELISPIAPQFASPEQLLGGAADFRSELFSLGALSCFLLTGAVPLAGRAGSGNAAERRLPRGAQIPRPMRNLLQHLLRADPGARPQDPATFREEVRQCLQRVERPRLFTRGVAPVIRAPERSRTAFSGRRLLPLGLAAAALLLLAGLLYAVAPNRVRLLLGRQRPIAAIGVPVGVPDSAAAPPAPSGSQNVQPGETNRALTSQRGAMLAAPTLPPQTSSAPLASASTESDRQTVTVPPVTTSATPAPSNGLGERRNFPPIAFNEESPPPAPAESAEPAPPAEGPASSPGRSRNFADQTIWKDAIASNTPATPDFSSRPAGLNKKPALPTQSGRAETASSPIAPNSARKQSAKEKRVVSSRKPKRSLPQLRVGDSRAEFVGTNSQGNWVLRLPSGDTVVTPPVPNPDAAPLEKHGRVRRVKGLPPEDHSADPPVIAYPVEE